MKHRKVWFISLSTLMLMVVLLIYIAFLPTNGLNIVLHSVNIVTLICLSVSLGIIVLSSYRKNTQKFLLVVNCLAALLSIIGIALILYNLPSGFNYPVDRINGVYMDGTRHIISGIMSIIISVLLLTVFHVTYKLVKE